MQKFLLGTEQAYLEVKRSMVVGRMRGAEGMGWGRRGLEDLPFFTCAPSVGGFSFCLVPWGEGEGGVAFELSANCAGTLWGWSGAGQPRGGVGKTGEVCTCASILLREGGFLAHFLSVIPLASLIPGAISSP